MSRLHKPLNMPQTYTKMETSTRLEQIAFWKSALRKMHESPKLKEQTIKKEQELALHDAQIRAVLETIYLEKDRASSFQRFLASPEFAAKLAEIGRHMQNNKNASICEIGAGPGFLAVGLAMRGYTNVSILEPNGEYVTGTGFIAETAAKHGVKIWNDLNAWYKSDDLYECAITNATVHHFDNVCKVAAEIRCKLAGHGKWLMFDEYFATTSPDLYQALLDHSHVMRYEQYEWPYPATIYVQLLRLAGYELAEVIPRRYKNNHIARNYSGKVALGGAVTQVTRPLIALGMTTIAFNLELLADRLFGLSRTARLFTLPQLLVFRAGRDPYPPPAATKII